MKIYVNNGIYIEREGYIVERFIDKNVIITGGSRGIGSEIVRDFCREGANVYFIYNSRP